MEPTKLDGNDTTLSHHPYFLCHFANYAHHKLSRCTLPYSYSHSLNEHSTQQYSLHSLPHKRQFNLRCSAGLKFHNIPYSGKFSRGRNFAIFAIKRQLAKISSSKNFLLTTRDELRTVTLSTCSVFKLSRRSSKSTEKLSLSHQAWMIVPRVLYYPCIEQSAEIFRDLRYLPVITATANRSSELAPSLWHGSSSPTATNTL